MTNSIWQAMTQRAALGLALIVGLAGCAGQAATPAGPAATATISASAPSPTATFAVLPDASTSDGPACVASQLKLSFAINFSASTEMGTVTNTSRTACSVFGFPDAQLLDAQRQPMTTRVSQATSGPWSGVFPEQRLQVAPGASVYFAVIWDNTGSDNQSNCAEPSYFAMTPPGDSSAVTASDPLTTCDGVLTISPFQPAPFMAS